MITLDTNVFVYAFDADEPVKRQIAQGVVEAVRARRGGVTLQLIGELQNVLRRKLRMEAAVAAEAARRVLTTYRTFPYASEEVRSALAQVEGGRLSYWDSLMLAASRKAGCTIMISEDMQDGATLFGLEIVNPFGAAGASPRAAELLDLA